MTKTWNGEGGGREEEKAPPAMKQKEPGEKDGWYQAGSQVSFILLYHPANGDLPDNTSTDRML